MPKVNLTIDWFIFTVIGIYAFALFYAKYLVGPDEHAGIAFVNVAGQLTCSWLVLMYLNQKEREPNSVVLRITILIGVCRFVKFLTDAVYGILS